MPVETAEVLRGDREKVVFFVEHLRKAFEDYVNARAEEGNEIGYQDALLAVHNFHKLIIMDVEERSGIRAQGQPAIDQYRGMWVNTFRMALIGTPGEKAAIRAKNES